jgi:hypothetical protein
LPLLAVREEAEGARRSGLRVVAVERRLVAVGDEVEVEVRM